MVLGRNVFPALFNWFVCFYFRFETLQGVEVFHRLQPVDLIFDGCQELMVECFCDHALPGQEQHMLSIGFRREIGVIVVLDHMARLYLAL